MKNTEKEKRIAKKRSIFIAAEGESDANCVAWFNMLLREQELHIYLNCQPLHGGGYQTMLNEAKRSPKYKQRNKKNPSILLVDTDRADRQEDLWNIEQLRAKAKNKASLTLFTFSPNLEGLLLRLHLGKEKLIPDASTVKNLLKKVWPEYYDKVKPASAATLNERFSFDSLKKVASVDADLKRFLELVGFNLTE